MKRVVHLTTQWPTIYQTFVRADIEISRDYFDSVAIIGPFLKSRDQIPILRENSSLKSFLLICARVFSLRRNELHALLIICRHTGVLKTLYILVSAFRVIHKANISSYPSQVTVHAHFLSNSTKIALTIKLLFPEITFIATGHGSDVFFNQPCMLNLFVKCADYILCASKAVEISIKDALKTDHQQKCSILVRYCRSFYNKPEIFDVGHFQGGALKIVTVGRMTFQKGWDITCKTASLLKSSGVKFQWVFIGDGELLSEMKALCWSLGLTDEISFKGALAHDEVIKYINLADLVVCPAIVHNKESDGLPVVILEAMSMSKVVISNDVGGISEALSNDRGVIVLPSPENFRNSILKVISGEIDGESIAKNAKAWVEANCSFGEDDPLAHVYDGISKI